MKASGWAKPPQPPARRAGLWGPAPAANPPTVVALPSGPAPAADPVPPWRTPAPIATVSHSHRRRKVESDAWELEEKSKSARVSGQVGENQEMIITEKTIVVRGQWQTESQSQMHDGSWQSESQSQMHDDGSWQSHWQESEWQEKEHADWKWQDQNETQARPKAKAMPPTDQAQPVQQQAVVGTPKSSKKALEPHFDSVTLLQMDETMQATGIHTAAEECTGATLCYYDGKRCEKRLAMTMVWMTSKATPKARACCFRCTDFLVNECKSADMYSNDQYGETDDEQTMNVVRQQQWIIDTLSEVVAIQENKDRVPVTPPAALAASSDSDFDALCAHHAS